MRRVLLRGTLIVGTAVANMAMIPSTAHATLTYGSCYGDGDGHCVCGPIVDIPYCQGGSDCYAIFPQACHIS